VRHYNNDDDDQFTWGQSWPGRLRVHWAIGGDGEASVYDDR
jgi:hypothetical protein